MTTPTGRDLDVELARLMGWTKIDLGGDGEPVGNPPGEFGWKKSIPAYRTSLDALFAPGGPVEYARNKGLRFSLDWSPDLQYEGAIFRDREGLVMRYAAGPAEALATALHEAFMKEQGQEMNDAE